MFYLSFGLYVLTCYLGADLLFSLDQTNGKTRQKGIWFVMAALLTIITWCLAVWFSFPVVS